MRSAFTVSGPRQFLKAGRKFAAHLRNCRKCVHSNNTFCHTGSFLYRKMRKLEPPTTR